VSELNFEIFLQPVKELKERNNFFN